MNKCLLIHNICLVLAMAPIVSHATDAAAAETVSPGAGRPNGGDYSIPAPILSSRAAGLASGLASGRGHDTGAAESRYTSLP